MLLFATTSSTSDQVQPVLPLRAEISSSSALTNAWLGKQDCLEGVTPHVSCLRKKQQLLLIKVYIPHSLLANLGKGSKTVESWKILIKLKPVDLKFVDEF